MAYVDPPRGNHKSYRVVFRLPGRPHPVRLPGGNTKTSAERLRARVQMLIDASHHGDPPPRELAPWLASMSPKLAGKLADLGLLDARRREQGKPIGDHVDEYERAVRARRNNTEHHAQTMAANVRRIVAGLNVATYSDLRRHDVAVWVHELDRRPATKRQYLIALEDFCRWMVRTNRAGHNPVEGLEKPAPTPAWDRRPFTHPEIRKLLSHLEGLEHYPKQSRGSLGTDRRMAYWAACYTAFRRNELAGVRKRHLILDAKPARIHIEAGTAKNRTEAEVPIPGELAEALRAYTADLDPNDRVFKLPKEGYSRDGQEPWLIRDLKAAKLGALLESGQRVDFHCFRATAIVWWLQGGRTLLEVKELARFKTLAMVQKYARGFRLTSFDWVDDSPSVTARPIGRKLGAPRGSKVG